MSQPTISESEFFLTSDLGLATILSLYFTLEDIDHSDPRKAFFVFKQQPKLNQILVAYFNNDPTLTVRPQVFFNQLRDVKARLYAER